MLVFLRAGLVLLATPKTGSTALHMALTRHADIVTRGLPAAKHLSHARYRRLAAPLVEALAPGPVEVCALVRDPVDWLGSWYRYRRAPALDGTANSTAGMDFDGFATAWASDAPPSCARVGNQAAFLTLPDGRGVDILWRYEAMDGFTRWLSDRIGTAVTLPRANVSATGPTALTPALHTRLEHAFAPDRALWTAARH